MKSKFLRGCLNKCKKTKHCNQYSTLWPSNSSSSLNEDEDDEESISNCSNNNSNTNNNTNNIPSDVPKGHLVVYVGENLKRYVIKVALLHHPLFRALLDEAQEEYDFIAHSKLCIPCDEHIFLNVLHCASSPQNHRVCLCL